MISLQDLLKITKNDVKRTKVKFNQFDGINLPLQDFVNNSDYVNDFKLFWRSEKRYFNVGELAINFVQMTADTWLLTTIKEVTEELSIFHGQNWRGQELQQYSDYYGRLVVRFKKTTRLTVLWYEPILPQLEVVELLPEIYGGEDFSGYDRINLSYYQLESILRIGKKDWVTALKNQKAVYLLVDDSNGKQYVGSATSASGMLLSRWSTYIETGHGGNKDLRRLVDEQGFDHIKNHFHYILLENYNGKVDDHYIWERESWWKQALLSREFGYNFN